MFVDIYTSTASILAVTDEIYESQIHRCAIAKHGLQFPGLHSAFPLKSGKFRAQYFFTGD